MNDDITPDVERRLRNAFTAGRSITRGWEDAPTAATVDALLADVVIGSDKAHPSGHRRAPLLAAAAVIAIAAVPTVLLARSSDNGHAPAAALPTLATASATSSPTSKPTSTSTSSLPVTPVTITPGRTAQLGPASPEVGVTYSFDLFTHCGITYTMFGGREWQAVDPQPEPSRLPDAGGITHYDGYTAGTATLTDASTLKVTVGDPQSAADGKSYLFKPATAQSPMCA